MGAVLSNSVYDAYGVESTTGAAPGDAFVYDARWGYLLDRETGLYCCQARYYDPQAGRWVTRDPIGYSGGVNLYGYCAGGTVGAADPSGLQMDGGYMPPPYAGGGEAGGSQTIVADDEQDELIREAAEAAEASALTGLAPEPLPVVSTVPATSTGGRMPGWYVQTEPEGTLPYVGSSQDLFDRVRPGHHQLDLGAGVNYYNADCGETMTRRELEVEEQRIINSMGGLDNVRNRRNPVAQRYWPQYGIPDVSRP